MLGMQWMFIAVAGILHWIAGGVSKPPTPAAVLISALVFVCLFQAILIALKWKISWESQQREAASENTNKGSQDGSFFWFFRVRERNPKKDDPDNQEGSGVNAAIARYTAQLRTA